MHKPFHPLNTFCSLITVTLQLHYNYITTTLQLHYSYITITLQLHSSFVKMYVIISRMIGILTSEFLTIEIGFKILSDITKV
jgi:hypothetical protein